MAKIASQKVFATEGRFRRVFADGTVREGSITDYPQHIRDAAAAIGLAEVLANSYASAKEVAEAIAAHDRRDSLLRAGTWAAASGGGTPDIVVAISRLRNVSQEEAQTFWDSQDDNTKSRLRKHDKLATIVKEIQLERAKAKASASPTDEDDLFGDLGGQEAA